MRDTIRFLKAGELIELTDVAPTEMLLDYLRLRRRESGTKEGCGEGDCGACTVAIGRLVNGKLIYQSVNSCIFPLGAIDGTEIVTVEDLSSEKEMHPVQKAMVDLHGSQCGFCTPGFVMSLFTLYHSEGKTKSRVAVTDWLAGNLCRCTGYRPIIEAALHSCFEEIDDAFVWRENDTKTKLRELADQRDIFIGDQRSFFAAPASIAGLNTLYSQHPDAIIVAGATDVGLWVTKSLRDLPKIISLTRIEDLEKVEDTPAGVLLGATATYDACEKAISGISKDLGELWRRIGSKQVRNSGTVGGNIANASPIGDTPPALIALGTTLELINASNSRTLPLEDFFLEYGKKDLRDGEIVAGVFVPRLGALQHFKCYKISKRFDQDISAVMGAFRITLDTNGTILEARIAYGGMAGIPKRANQAEDALKHARLDDPSTWNKAIQLLEEDFEPLSDMRASANYRLETARALLAKALMEISGTPSAEVNILAHREAQYA